MRLAILASTLILAACSGERTSPPETIAADAADSIYSGGPIYTADDAQTMVETVAVRDGLIVYAGDAASLPDGLALLMEYNRGMPPDLRSIRSAILRSCTRSG